jgi:hypothetical protein
MAAGGGRIMGMAGDEGLSLRRNSPVARGVTALCALVAVGTGVAGGLGALGQATDWMPLCGGCLMTVYVATTMSLLRRVEAGPAGLRFRTSFRWTRLEWNEIAGFEERRVQPGDRNLSTYHLRTVARLRTGEDVWLPLPYVRDQDAFGFEDDLRALRAVRRRYTAGSPQLP